METGDPGEVSDTLTAGGWEELALCCRDEDLVRKALRSVACLSILNLELPAIMEGIMLPAGLTSPKVEAPYSGVGMGVGIGIGLGLTDLPRICLRSGSESNSRRVLQPTESNDSPVLQRISARCRTYGMQAAS